MVLRHVAVSILRSEVRYLSYLLPQNKLHLYGRPTCVYLTPVEENIKNTFITLGKIVTLC